MEDDHSFSITAIFFPDPAVIVTQYDVFGVSLDRLVDDAWSLRDEFDLSKISYGRVHWGDFKQILTKPFSYYYFLAGLVRLTGARRVLEVGTHQGGSARAMATGFTDPANSRLVTFDVTDYGAKLFKGHPSIRAYTIDANSQAAFETCLTDFGGPRIDMAFVDSTHEFWTTLQSFNVAAALLSCPIIVLDDITLNESMSRLWSFIRDRYGSENTIDAVEVHSAIREGGGGTRPGFGVVRIPPHDSADLRNLADISSIHAT